MRLWFTLIFTLTSTILFSQSDSLTYSLEINTYQQQLNDSFKDPKESPLEPKELKKFKGLDFFPASLRYNVTAKVVVFKSQDVFDMPTTTGRTRKYIKFGKILFKLNGKECELNIYQSVSLSLTEKYKNYILLPFTDLTTGKQAYDGGRFIDLEIPKGDSVVIDFNKSYNPSCAYSNRFSCPLTPAENHLEVEVLAGVRMKKQRHHSK